MNTPPSANEAWTTAVPTSSHPLSPLRNRHLEWVVLAIGLVITAAASL